MEAFHFFWFQVSDFRMLNFEFFGTQIGGIGLILKISFTRLSPWAKSKANGNVLHRDARSFFEVDCVERNAWRNLIFFGFKFQVLLTRLSPWAESKANENSFTQRYTEIFLKWIVLREMHGGVSLFLVSSFRFSNVEFWIFWNTDWRNWINFKN